LLENDLRLSPLRVAAYANRQGIAYVYGHADKRDAEISKSITLDEARRVAANIAKLAKLLGNGS
jgi:hypothetical protein